MEAAGDHEVEDEPEVALDADGDALADSAEGCDGAAFSGGEWRIDGAEEEDGGETNRKERLAEDARLKCVDVGGDVGEFRH